MAGNVTYKMNVVSIRGSAAPECTHCGHRFTEIKGACNPYEAMCRLAMGKFPFCPCCGAKYAGCQIEGVDFDECTPNDKSWILSGCQ